MTSFIEINLNKLTISDFNVRKQLSTPDDENNLDELAESIKKDGLINPISVRQISNSDRYEIFAGQRRYLAAKKIGLETIMCQISKDDDDKAELKSLLENVQRSNMTATDKCSIYLSLFKKCDNDIEQVSKYTSVTTTTLKKYIKIASELSEELISKLNEKGSDKLTIEVAEKLCKIPKEIQEKVLVKMSDSNLNNKSRINIISNINNRMEDFDSDNDDIDDIIDSEIKEKIQDNAEECKAITVCDCKGNSRVYDNKNKSWVNIPDNMKEIILKILKNDTDTESDTEYVGDNESDNDVSGEIDIYDENSEFFVGHGSI